MTPSTAPSPSRHRSHAALRRSLTLAGLLGGALGACSSDLSSNSTGGDGTGAGLGADGPIFGDGVSAAEGNPSGYFAGQACAGQTAGAEAASSVLELLVDTSGSMDQDAPNSRGSKWTVTRRAVLDAVTEMPEDTSLGVVFYPNVPNDSDPCFEQQTAVAIDRLGDTAQRQRVQQAFQRQRPEGGTPTHDAYRYALDLVGTTQAIGTRVVVLITDGIPTYSLGCVGTGRQEDAVDAAPMIEEAASALARGVQTFVIGSPGSEGARESLSRMAEAGGTALANCSHSGPTYCHFDMTEESDLAAGLSNALGLISGITLSCNYGVPSAPAGAVLDPAKVNVLFTPPGGAEELIPQGAGRDCADGWQYNTDQTQIRLCGPTCDRVRGSDGSLTLQFGCATELR
jgi:hypothetical protein